MIVATHEVPVGTTVDDARSQGYLGYQSVRQSDVADGAITSFGAVAGQVITQNLYNGDQLTLNRVGAPRTQTPAYQVTGNFRAIRVPFNPNSGLLSDLSVNDRVDVLTSYRNNDKVFTYLAVPDALVLEVDAPTLDTAVNSGSEAGSVLLSVTEQQSLFIANALANSSGRSERQQHLAGTGRRDRSHLQADHRADAAGAVPPPRRPHEVEEIHR